MHMDAARKTMPTEEQRTPMSDRIIEILSLFRESNLPKDFIYWIDQAVFYAQENAVNEKAIIHIFQSLYWGSLYRRRRFYNRFKRAMDFTASVMLMVILSPVFVLLGVAIKMSSPGPVFYKQIRMGQSCRPFYIYKFRTLSSGARRTVSFINSRNSQGTNRAFRVTKVGFYLRAFSLDELPQLINVAKGDMSLVGPRPLTPCDTSTTPLQYFDRFAVKPGMTGFWQALIPLEYRGSEKLRYDTVYARKYSFWLDCKILLSTIPAVIKKAVHIAIKRSPSAKM
jgi:lipopolysaccharide/colanic/teichoic acid biosynthesis glycosyltransferase